jgi:hypothetical protein
MAVIFRMIEITLGLGLMVDAQPLQTSNMLGHLTICKKYFTTLSLIKLVIPAKLIMQS